MLAIQFSKQIQRSPLRPIGNSRRRREVQQRRPLTAKQCPLIRRRHEPARPIRRTSDRPTARIGHHHEARQVRVLGPQAVAQPRSQAGLADEHAAGIHLQAPRSVRRRVRVHRPNHANVIRMFRRVRKQTADRQPALAMRPKRKRRLHQIPDRPPVRPDLRLSGVRRPMKSLQRRLRIKRVNLARPTIHKQKHAMLRPPKMRSLRSQRMYR